MKKNIARIDENTFAISETSIDVSDTELIKQILNKSDLYEKYKVWKDSEAEFKKAYEPIKAQLIQLMEDTSEKVVTADGLKFTYISPSIRTGIDSKKLKEEEPEIFEKYSKITPVSSTIKLEELP